MFFEVLFKKKLFVYYFVSLISPVSFRMELSATDCNNDLILPPPPPPSLL